jgi:hypothetical protein
MFSFNKNSANLTVFLNGVMHTVPADAPNFRAVWAAIKSEDEEAIEHSLNVLEHVEEAFSSVIGAGIQVTETGVFVNGRPIHNSLSEKILEFMREGISFAPLVKFLEKFMQNPLVSLASNPEVLAMMGKSPEQAGEIVDEFTNDFYSFLNNKNLPVTDTGNFLAYKSVNEDYYSVTAGKTVLTKGHVNERGQVYNGIGEEIECDRGQVDPSRRAECSYGLHVGSIDYVRSFGGRKIVVVEVNPKDVVAIPPDCNRQKMRVCAYSVLQDFRDVLTKPAYKVDQGDIYAEDAEYSGYDEDSYAEEFDSADDIYTGDVIKFSYFKNGETKTRYLEVVELEYADDEETQVTKVVGILQKPEDKAGEYRSFRASNMSDIQLLN